MKTLVIGDIHEDLGFLQRIKEIAYNYPRVVFVGDYFDSWTHTPQKAAQTAQWVINHIDTPGWEFLLGNHDIHYISHLLELFPQLKCTGYNFTTSFMLRDLSFPWEKLKYMSILPSGHVVSHAGVGQGLLAAIRKQFSSEEDMTWYHSPEEVEQLTISYPRWKDWFNVGKDRGGRDKFGGIFWLDSMDLKLNHPDGWRQIVGHTCTESKYPTRFMTDWFIDTNQNCIGVEVDDCTGEVKEVV